MKKKVREICEFEIDVEKSFCFRFNLNNHNIISALRPGLITVMDFRCQFDLKTSVENDIFWTEIRSEFREPAAHPH